MWCQILLPQAGCDASAPFPPEVRRAAALLRSNAGVRFKLAWDVAAGMVGSGMACECSCFICVLFHG